MLNEKISFGELNILINNALLDGANIEDKKFASLLDCLAQPKIYSSIFQEILDSPELLSRVAGQSYRHINHFDKIVLVGSDDFSALRLTVHLWNPPFLEEQLKDELIHEHRFCFWSTILAGTLTSQDFVEMPEGEPYRAYRYYPEKDRSQSFNDFYEYQRQVRLKKMEPVCRSSGETYFLSAPTIHQINIDDARMCCTLVLRGPRLKDHSTIYNTTYPVTDTSIGNQMYSQDELAKKLSIILDNIGMLSIPLI